MQEKFKNKYLKYTDIIKPEINVIIHGNIEVLRIAYVIESIKYLQKIPIAFHNRSNYDCYFIIK